MSGKKRLNISASKLRCYKECFKKYWFRYHELLRPVETAEPLETGLAYHECISKALQGQSYTAKTPIVDCMVTAFKDMPWDTVGINPREIVTEIPFETSLFRGVHLNGRIDGACGGQIIEHKTTALLNDKYYEHLAYDDQITFYLTAFSLMKKTPKTSVVYTIIQKPSIRQKQNETEEEYIQRVKEWYSDNRDKVSIVRVARTKEQLAESYKEIREIASDMRTRTNFYRNPSHCLHLPCEYNSICLNYSPEILINFKREEEKHNGRREQSKDFNND